MGRDDGAMRKLLDELRAEAGATACAIVSRSGVPLAHILPEEAHVDNFATMAATLVGAVDVILEGLHRDTPRRVVIEADGNVLVLHAITEGAFVVALVPSYTPKVGDALAAVAKRAKTLLGGGDMDAFEEL